MRNRDKRTIALSLLIGDGNIHLDRKRYARFTIDHGVTQSDYQAWKASLLSYIFDRDVRCRTGHKGKSIQISVSNNVFKAWYKFCYVNKHKSIPKILKWTNNPYFTLAMWLMDDGYVETNGGTINPSSARFRIFSCDQTEEELSLILTWFKEKFNYELKIAYTKGKNKNYPYLKFNAKDTYHAWLQIREQVLKFKSMQYKFRHIEKIYQFKSQQDQMQHNVVKR